MEALGYRFPAGLDWARLLERLKELHYRAALVGPEGRGKTTLLEQLGEHLEERGFSLRRATLRRGQRRLPPETRRRLLADLGPRDVLLLDGAQELGRWAWRRIERRSRAAAGLVITSHREGLLPTLLHCETSPALLAELAQELAQREPDAVAGVDLDALYRRHGGNVRDALWELYDRWAAGS